MLSAVDALDVAPDIAATPQTGVVIGRKVIPEWALRLLLAALLIRPLLLAADGYARLRRRRGASGDRAMGRGLAVGGGLRVAVLRGGLFAKRWGGWAC